MGAAPWNPKLDAYIAAGARSIPTVSAEVREALDLIGKRMKPAEDGQALQLLALRRYLRLGPKRVQAQWSWSADQAAVLVRQGAAKVLVDEAAKVQSTFARANPGYVLALSPLRSLERQVRLWNGNSSVQRAATDLRARFLEDVNDPDDYPNPPTGESIAVFNYTLRVSIVKPEPTSAAPGTSDHGQMRAVDFVVMRSSGALVAGTKSSSIASVWKQGGWEAKLMAATAGTQLVGPLQHPYEPWHWRLTRA
jgi:hypothetical protein